MKQKLLDVTTAMWAWNPGTDQVCVVPHPDVRNLAGSYNYTAGACYAFVRRLTPAQREQYAAGGIPA